MGSSRHILESTNRKFVKLQSGYGILYKADYNSVM